MSDLRLRELKRTWEASGCVVTGRRYMRLLERSKS